MNDAVTGAPIAEANAPAPEANPIDANGDGFTDLPERVAALETNVSEIARHISTMVEKINGADDELKTGLESLSEVVATVSAQVENMQNDFAQATDRPTAESALSEKEAAWVRNVLGKFFHGERPKDEPKKSG